MKYLLPLVFLLAFSISCSDDCPTCPRDGISNRTWYIKADGTGDAPTIQAGIDSAIAGDTVLVAPGTYSDTTHVRIDQEVRAVNVYMYKSIKLLAEGAPFNTMIDGNQSDIAIYAEGVGSVGEVRGFTIRAKFHGFFCLDGGFSSKTNLQSLESISIYCEDSDLRISGNELNDNRYAIYLIHSPVVITSNIIRRAMGGILCDAGSNATIQNNEINGCGGAILCYDQASPTIIDNNISGGCAGIYANASLIAGNRFSSIEVVAIAARNGTVIEDNLFVEVDEAISLWDSVLVRNNLFYNIGMAIEYSGRGSFVEHNTVDNAAGFIFAQSAGSLTIRNNIVTRANSGISSPDNTYIIECNNLFDISGEKYGWALSDQTGINGNISVDPRFCDANIENYYLSGNSPCAPGNHPDGYDCGLIGALTVGCDALFVE